MYISLKYVRLHAFLLHVEHVQQFIKNLLFKQQFPLISFFYSHVLFKTAMSAMFFPIGLVSWQV